MVVVLNPSQTNEALSINADYAVVAAAIGTDDQLLQSKKQEAAAKLAELQNMMKMQPRDFAAEQIIFNEMDVLKSEIEALELSLAPHLADMILLQNRSGALFADIRQTNGNATDDEIFVALNTITDIPTISPDTLSIAFPPTVVGDENIVTYNVEAVHLVSDLTITSDNTTITLSTDGITYHNSISITPDPSGTVPLTMIHVKFMPIVDGTQSGNLNHTSLYAVPVDVTYTGDGLIGATILATPPAVSFGITPVGVPVIVTYDIVANNLIGNLTITSDNPKTLILDTDGVTYVMSSVLTPDPSGHISATIYLQYTPPVSAGDIGTITNSSPTATDATVTWDGVGV